MGLKVTGSVTPNAPLRGLLRPVPVWVKRAGCQMWKDELEMRMGFRAWRETPGLRRRQHQQRLQFTPGFAIILGSIHRTQFRPRVERARLR